MFLCIKLLPGLLGLDPTNDMLRVPLNEEIKGLDVSYHDGDEYPPYLVRAGPCAPAPSPSPTSLVASAFLHEVAYYMVNKVRIA